MRKALSLLILAFWVFTANAQSQDSTSGKGKSRVPFPKVYFNLSSGINNNAGLLGFGFDIPVSPEVSLEPGVGVGSWGYKLYGCGKYYFDPGHRGWAIGVGATYSTGLDRYEAEMETTYGYSEHVVLKLEPQLNAFAAAYRFWNMGRRHNRVYLELGYSRALTTDKFTQLEGTPLSTNSAKVLRFISPGGVIVGVGFSFGGYKPQSN